MYCIRLCAGGGTIYGVATVSARAGDNAGACDVTGAATRDRVFIGSAVAMPRRVSSQFTVIYVLFV